MALDTRRGCGGCARTRGRGSRQLPCDRHSAWCFSHEKSRGQLPDGDLAHESSTNNLGQVFCGLGKLCPFEGPLGIWIQLKDAAIKREHPLRFECCTHKKKQKPFQHAFN